MTFDNASPPNLWVTSDATNHALLTKISPSDGRVDIPYGDITSHEAIGQLAKQPGSIYIWMLTQSGNIVALDTTAPTGWLPVANLKAMPVDTNAMYDVATGRVHNGNGVVNASIASYGDIALLQRDTFFDAFITGESLGFPFVARLRWRTSDASFQGAKVVAYSSQTTSLRNVRGVAVSPQGTVLTILPLLESLPIDRAVYFHADFPEGGGSSPVFLDRRIGNFTASGMTADAAGWFYAPAYTGTCGETPSYALLALNPDFTGGVCYPLPEPANAMVDVTVRDDGTLAFVTSYGSGKLWGYQLAAQASGAAQRMTPARTSNGKGRDDFDAYIADGPTTAAAPLAMPSATTAATVSLPAEVAKDRNQRRGKGHRRKQRHKR